ncbi:MAG: aspartate aminotransferase family protein [Alphaproteobacteria bacterium]|nr:aspartate aminotransferase family protein [Alphaproteobacteria bacterium]MCW5752131.1 aspartate aminotransferase family protein [Alphaproteobacteria bacterium]
MSHILHRSARSLPIEAVRAEGLYIYDKAGNRYMDACGGAAVSCLGHAHPRVVEAVRRQIGELDYVHTSVFTNGPAEALADTLIAGAPKGLTHVYYVSGGSEAIEAAIKMARQFFVETGEPGRHRIIARWQSYHGNTLGALSAGGNKLRRKIYEPLLVEMSHISPCYAYRGRRDDETEEAYGLRVADELEAEILRLGPGSVAAFVAEPVVGATLGSVPAVPGYFRRIREICDRYGVLLILDEVMCGMGRTGSLHACEQEGIAPDMLVVAKGLGGGFQPIGAILLSARIFEGFRDGSGSFMHGHTYMAHPVACAAALAVQQVIAGDDLIANVRAQGRILAEALEERLGNHAHVGDIRGRGLFQSIELVRERASKEPFAPALRLNQRIHAEAMARGLICYPMGGTIDGLNGDHVLLAPPFNIAAEDTRRIAELLGDAVDAAVGKLA